MILTFIKRGIYFPLLGHFQFVTYIHTFSIRWLYCGPQSQRSWIYQCLILSSLYTPVENTNTESTMKISFPSLEKRQYLRRPCPIVKKTGGRDWIKVSISIDRSYPFSFFVVQLCCMGG